MKFNKRSLAKLFPFVFIMFAVLFLIYNNVDNSLTKEDLEYIPKYLKNIKVLSVRSAVNNNKSINFNSKVNLKFKFKDLSYNEELKLIKSIQKAVLEEVPNHIAIPLEHPREPKELYLNKSGLCFDRSRVIEKILRYAGFKTRHISMFSLVRTGSAFKSLFRAGSLSHAVSEVLTKRGWLIVESNDLWLSLDQNNNPISMQRVKKTYANSKIIAWQQKPLNIYIEPVMFVYGLYSRHGKFYKPYTFVPDINYKEFLDNFI